MDVWLPLLLLDQPEHVAPVPLMRPAQGGGGGVGVRLALTVQLYRSTN